MKASIDIPTNMVEVLQARAAKSQSSLEDAVLEVLKVALSADVTAKEKLSGNSMADSGYHVRLPIVRSSHPGTLRSLNGAQIDDLLV